MTFKDWKLAVSVLGCPINCTWLAMNSFGNCCCSLGLKICATILEEEIMETKNYGQNPGRLDNGVHEVH